MLLVTVVTCASYYVLRSEENSTDEQDQNTNEMKMTTSPDHNQNHWIPQLRSDIRDEVIAKDLYACV